MTPYGYHTNEMSNISRDERLAAREAIRQAKLAKKTAAHDETVLTTAEAPRMTTAKHLIAAPVRLLTRPFTNLRHSRPA
jgi:hypothetical protein